MIVLAATALAQDARQIIEEVQRRARSNSQRYEGTLEVIGAGIASPPKRWMFERIGSFGDSKAMLRFTAPAEVKGVALLIVNHPDRASDQWMWRPSIGRDQRIALQDRSTRFFGTDFSFEDLEERDVAAIRFQAARRRKRAMENRVAATQVVAIHLLVFVGEERQLHHRQS